MISSLLRIFVIGRITFTEAVRQKVLSVLLIFALVLVSCSIFFSGLSTPDLDSTGIFDEQIKWVKDAGSGAIDIFGCAIAILSTALLIPQELHNRTIYTILAKPVRRAEFIVGKFIGVVMLLALCIGLMSIAFFATLSWQEVRAKAAANASYGNVDQQQLPPEVANKYNSEIQHIEAQTRDPHLVEVIALLFTKTILIAAIALLISTFATSFIFTTITTLMVLLIGNMEGTARAYWLLRGAEAGVFQNSLVGFISMLVPDFGSFTIIDEILAGHAVPWLHALNLIGYSGVYLLVVLALSIVIFDYREL